MKKILLTLALWLASLPAFAQCNGVFPANTLCGNLTGSPAPPSAFTASGTVAGPATSVIGHFATWANTVGTLLADFNLYAAANVWSGSNNFTSTFQINGNTVTWPATTGTVPFLGTNQTWTGNNTFSTGTDNFTGTFQIGGVTVTLPVSVPNGGTGNATATANTVPINNGTSAQAATNVGTTGSCVAGVTGGTPQFTAGCRELLVVLTANNSTTLTDTTHITSAYTNYELVFNQLIVGTNNSTCVINVYVTGVLQTSGYFGTYSGFSVGLSRGGYVTYGVPCSYQASTQANTQPGINGTIRLYSPSITSTTHSMLGAVVFPDGTGESLLQIGGGYNAASGAVTGIQVCDSTSPPTCLTGANGLVSGTVSIYGIN